MQKFLNIKKLNYRVLRILIHQKMAGKKEVDKLQNRKLYLSTDQKINIQKNVKYIYNLINKESANNRKISHRYFTEEALNGQ